MGRYNSNDFITPRRDSIELQDLDIKLAMIGEISVGKTSIVSRIVYNDFYINVGSTIGGAFSTFSTVRNNYKIKFHIWDTAGQERFKSLVPMYVENTQIVVLVFDVTSYESFRQIQDYWYEYVNNISPDSVKILIGNKVDLKNKQTVSNSVAKAYAKELNMQYIEVSAKENINISAFTKALVKIGEPIKATEKTEVNTNYNPIVNLDDSWDRLKNKNIKCQCN